MATKTTISRLRHKTSLSRRSLMATAGIIILIGVAIWLIFRPEKPKQTTTIPSTTPTAASSTSANKNSDSSKQAIIPSNSTSSKAPSTTSSGKAPLEPSGPFVSNHFPSLTNSSAPSKEQSVCNTTPGASCYIAFVNGSVEKKLSTQIANSDGATVWVWDVNQAELTPGKWQITAYAIMNGQTVSSQDSLVLSVQP